MVNKKAQGMSTSTIVLLILGLIILVVLILGFSMGWSRLAPWIDTNNIETIKTACSTACAVQSSYDYCTVKRTVNDGVLDKFDSTCYTLVEEHPEYGIEACTNVECVLPPGAGTV